MVRFLWKGGTEGCNSSDADFQIGISLDLLSYHERMEQLEAAFILQFLVWVSIFILVKLGERKMSRSNQTTYPLPSSFC